MAGSRYPLLRYGQVLAEARRSYDPQKSAAEARSEWLAAKLYRPASFWVTPLFLAFGFSADGVTVASIAVSVAMPAVALMCGGHAYLAVVACGLCVQVLDCVDGNIARMTRRFSSLGDMLDGLATLFFWAAYFAALGVATQEQHAGWVGAHGELVGLVLAVLLLAQREVEDTSRQYLGTSVDWGAGKAASSRIDLNRYGKLLEHLVAFGGLASAGAAGRLNWLLAAVAAYQAALLLFWVARFVASARARRRVTAEPRRYD
ncbi:MAG TPA: CDP-alcohol phosphatidyltransferase family protein [Opitutaceae bacterium]|jgi:phosphatidylserine synthase